MKIEYLKEARLSNMKDTFLFDSRVAGLDAQILNAYYNVLTSVIYFTGDIRIRELTPDHIEMYIANLSDGPDEGQENDYMVMSHAAVIDLWIHWLGAQRQLIERESGLVEPPSLTSLFPLLVSIKKLSYCC